MCSVSEGEPDCTPTQRTAIRIHAASGSDIPVLTRRFAAYSQALLLAAALLSGCGDESTPEQQIRTLIGAVETAVEARSAQDAAVFLHDGYRDEWHPDKRAALRSLLGYILRNRSIHLLTVIRDIEVAADELSAGAVVYVAMSGVPVESVEALVSVKADLMRFDVELLSTDDGWRVTTSRWQRVELADF